MRYVMFCVCFCMCVFASENRDWISYGIDGVIQSVDPTALVGVKVVSLDEGTVLYEKNAECRFVPASVVKMLTMGAALGKLGGEYCFETVVKGDGIIEKGVLKGDCYLVGSGDPSLKALDFVELVEGLSMREIRGDLVLDLSCFEDEAKGPGWMWDEEEAYWSVPMSALNVEHNFVHETVIVRPEELAAVVFKGLLDRKGILFRGKVRLGKAPDGSQVLSRHRSAPLKELIKTAMQDSDNLYANCIFKAMGGSWEKGRESLEGFLKELEMVAESLRVVDGSGESRYNLVSPNQMIEFLKAMEGNRIFKKTLAVGKESGTLRNRMRGFGGQVAGKTGSMTGVSGFSGFVTTEEGEHLAVAIFVNGYMKEGREIKIKLEDEICHILVNAPR